MTAEVSTLHAGCVLLGETGVLIRGRSGSGKSALARALIETGRARGRFAALVADDRVILRRHGDRLIARPHPRIAGLLELRGVGLVPVPHEPAAVVRLVADFSDSEPPRLPDPADSATVLLGRTLPRLALDSRRTAAENAALVHFRLAGATIS